MNELVSNRYLTVFCPVNPGLQRQLGNRCVEGSQRSGMGSEMSDSRGGIEFIVGDV
jgi:hypothetical protein